MKTDSFFKPCHNVKRYVLFFERNTSLLVQQLFIKLLDPRRMFSTMGNCGCFHDLITFNVRQWFVAGPFVVKYELVNLATSLVYTSRTLEWVTLLRLVRFLDVTEPNQWCFHELSIRIILYLTLYVKKPTVLNRSSLNAAACTGYFMPSNWNRFIISSYVLCFKSIY